MATSLNVAGSLSREEPALKGIRRSRFSIHFNTRRVRRWLLVQLVSIPAEPSADDDGKVASRLRAFRAAEHKSLDRLLDEYRDGALYRRCS